MKDLGKNSFGFFKGQRYNFSEDMTLIKPNNLTP